MKGYSTILNWAHKKKELSISFVAGRSIFFIYFSLALLINTFFFSTVYHLILYVYKESSSAPDFYWWSKFILRQCFYTFFVLFVFKVITIIKVSILVRAFFFLVVIVVFTTVQTIIDWYLSGFGFSQDEIYLINSIANGLYCYWIYSFAISLFYFYVIKCHYDRRRVTL